MSDQEQTIDDMDPAMLLEQANEAKDAGEREIAAKLYNAAGNIYMSVAEFEEALSSFEIALNLYKDLDDNVGVSDSTYNLGVAQINLEQWDEAVLACETAVDLFENASNKEGSADAKYGLALAKLGKGDFDGAMVMFKAAQKGYKATDNQQGIVSIIMDIGTAHADKEDWTAASTQIKKALKIYREIDDKAGIADALSLLGDIAEMNGNQKASAEYFVEASQCYLEAKIFEIAREVVERAEQKMWDVPKATRRRLRRVIDDIIDALPPAEPEDLSDEGLDENFPEIE